MPERVIAISPERFPQAALDITPGKLFLRFNLWEKQGAN
jgi:hypothetical protein